MKSNKLSIILIGTSVLLLCATLVGFFNVFMPSKTDSVKTDDVTFETETSISDVMSSLSKVKDISGISVYGNSDLTCFAFSGATSTNNASFNESLGYTLFKAGTYSCEIFLTGFNEGYNPTTFYDGMNLFGLSYYDNSTGETTGDPIWISSVNTEFTLTEDTWLCLFWETEHLTGSSYLAEGSDVAIIRLYWNHTPLETVTETVAETESVKETVSA